MLLTREEMLDRAMASDREFDGIFITGVLSTGIYCLPSCRARKPKPDNIQFFETVAEARTAGLRACKKCRPDDFFQGIDQDLCTLETAIATLIAAPNQCHSIDELAGYARMSSSKLFQCVRRHYHMTPGELINRCRVNQARRLLIETDRTVAEIAFEVGFENLSTFYDHFGRLNGMSPLSYRKLPQSSSFEMTLPKCFHPDVFLGYFGRDPDSLTEKVHGNRLWVSTKLRGEPAAIDLTVESERVCCQVDGMPTQEAHHAVSRMLGLSQDPSGFEQLALRNDEAPFVETRLGLRMPLTVALFDGIVWAILGQQVNLRFAYILRRRLTQLVGCRMGDQRMAPPEASDVAFLKVEDLLPLQFSRRKAEYLIDVSRQISEGRIVLEELELGAATRAEKTLLAVRGFGPWSTHYVMMRALGFADCLPLGDTGLTSALQLYFKLETRPNVEETKSLMARFSPYRSLASFHLWQSLKFES